jgi:hypothetical protein
VTFPLDIGDTFRHKGFRFEVIARMAFIEEGDLGELTRQYLLYHPRRGTRWLDEYGGQWSISKDTHVMPEKDAFSRQRGDLLATQDGQQWVAEGTGEYELIWVDGALPWIARIGDRIHYAEFSARDGSGRQYDAQRIEDEIEYGEGRTISLEAVRLATRKPRLGGGKKRPRKTVDAPAVRRAAYVIAAAAAVAALVNGYLFLGAVNAGRTIHSEALTAGQLNGEILSSVFQVTRDNTLIRVNVKAQPSLNNEWMSVNVGVVDGVRETLYHVYDDTIEYYHGVEGGERWSEGGQSKSVYIKIPKAGPYRLLLNAASARGNASSASNTTHGLRVWVNEAVRMHHYHSISGVFAVIVLVATLMLYHKWKKGDEED